MENEPAKQETEIEALARIVKTGFDRMDAGFEEMRDGFTKTGERFKAADRRVDLLDQKIDRLDVKVDLHRQETKDGFSGIHRLIGGISTTLADHEERIRALDAEV